MLDWPRSMEDNQWARSFLLSRGVWASDGAHFIFWTYQKAPVWVVAFDAWVGKTCQMHVVSSKARNVPKGLITACFKYAFIFQKREMVFGLVSSKNESALRLDKFLGFTESIRYPDMVSPGEDIVVLQMKKADCRWLKEKDEVLATHS